MADSLTADELAREAHAQLQDGYVESALRSSTRALEVLADELSDGALDAEKRRAIDVTPVLDGYCRSLVTASGKMPSAALIELGDRASNALVRLRDIAGADSSPYDAVIEVLMATVDISVPGARARTRRPTDEFIDEQDGVARWSWQYVQACVDVIEAFEAVLPVADRAVTARQLASQGNIPLSVAERHREIARAHEQQFVPLFKTFAWRCEQARQAARGLRQGCLTVGTDPDFILMLTVDGDAMWDTGRAAHILRTTFVSSPAGVVESFHRIQTAIQADIFDFGEAGYISHVYEDPESPSKLRECPWCAETIKAAAKICRFCNRDV